MNIPSDRPHRPYRMGSRAASAAATADRILQATTDLYAERYHDQIALDDIAARAGVTVQTILRRFHSRDELLDAAATRAALQVTEQRRGARSGDVAGAVDNLLDHYEHWGPPVLRLLSQEDRVPQLRRITDRGRELHADWVRYAFGPFVRTSRDADLLLAQLTAVTDVYVWKVLHLDLGLDRAATAAALGGVIEALVRKDDGHG